MPRLLLLFAHPTLEKSRVNAKLIKYIPSIKDLTFHDLYELYPDYDIDIKTEQQLLLEHEIIIMHHPFYWYSSPPIVKQWEDLVLEHGWAYGAKGKNLVGKYFLNAVTTGGPAEAYQGGTLNKYTIRQYLIPFEQTARLCNMTYLPPYLIQGTHRMREDDIEVQARNYADFLTKLTEGKIQPDDLLQFSTISEYQNEIQKT